MTTTGSHIHAGRQGGKSPLGHQHCTARSQGSSVSPAPLLLLDLKYRSPRGRNRYTSSSDLVSGDSFCNS